MLTFTCLIGGVANMMLSFYPASWWLVVAFRPDRAAGATYLMNDLAWLQLIGGVSIFLAMPLAVVVAAFLDRSQQPVFPRWCGFVNAWLVLMILPDQLLFFFHTGPFAWNGIFGLWIPVAAFAVFFFVNFIVMRKSLLREMQGLARGA